MQPQQAQQSQQTSKSPLETKLDDLARKVFDGKVIEELELTNGWKLARKVLTDIIAACDREILSNKYVSDHNGYLAQLGARNALQSFLDVLERKKQTGLTAAAQKSQTEQDNTEELNRVGISA